ncbi:transposon Tf2-1 polyprotein isoform X1 [Cucumis melo var. makuwa]|uniref:Transposon Tf2-1 polyprotein isoform X1 n=1 Tax=Cucumis melo var. makuwa TaxID=1194695 RepID=A0A5A7UG07_CUCMM|nr:transposon Tf2-1 polyprotein isoform X1 [Cucumis melo var. makuwa]
MKNIECLSAQNEKQQQHQQALMKNLDRLSLKADNQQQQHQEGSTYITQPIITNRGKYLYNPANYNKPNSGANANEGKAEVSTPMLADAEFKAKREKGLCFKCDEKYYSGHKSKEPELREIRMFVVNADNVEEEIIEEEYYEQKELSMKWKVREKIFGEEVVVLIDCGATHNFISNKLVTELKLSTKKTSHYGVILGSGTAIKGKGACENVELLLNDWKVTAEFLPLELGGVDAILGMQWLYSLGVTKMDWKNLTMTFHGENKAVIKGDPSLTKTQVGLKTLMKTWSDSDQGYQVKCRALEAEVLLPEEATIEENTSAPEEVQKILTMYNEVFEWPETLPPKRTIEHQIQLKTGTDPVNVRPYRDGCFGIWYWVVLMQNKRPIACFSHTLALRDRAKPVYERELMAVVLAVQRWRPYSLGRKFVVKTDQKSLKFLLEQRVIQPQYQKWIAELLGYSFEVVYKLGLENKAADALSGVPSSVYLNQLTAPTLIDLKIIKEEVEKDEQFKEILMKLQSGEEVQNYALQQEMLQYKGRLIIANKTTLIPAILHTYHNSVFGGHSGSFEHIKD